MDDGTEDQYCQEDSQLNKGLTLIPWNRRQCRSGPSYHLCGQNCAMQAMERLMTYSGVELEAV